MSTTSARTRPGWAAFEERMREIRDLDGILNLMSWDEETYCPDKGRGPRGRQNATLEAIRHQRMTDLVLGGLIEQLLGDPKLDATKRVAVQRMKQRRDRAVKLPESLVRAFAEARSRALEVWGPARKRNDFAAFAPELANIFRLSAERARALAGPNGDPYDALLDEFEPGMTRAKVAPVLAQLEEGLVPLVREIAGREKPERAFLSKRYPDDAQWAFTLRLLRDLSFDLERGRQDRSGHPFTSTQSEHDVRVTTRIFEDNPFSAIFSTVHEAGHGLYELGFDPAHHGTTLADAASLGLHESQSRLWENQIARSRPFLAHYLPALRELFPEQLEGVDADLLYRAVNVVEPGPIRVEADEVTYNLHILLRFQVETAMLSGDLWPRDLPGFWNERMKTLVGYAPKDDAEGCMQDIHWATGAVAYFPTYAIGNIYASQLMAAYEKAHPQVWDDVGHGRFAPLLSWLRTHVHKRGYSAAADDIVKDATGSGLDVAPFLAYVKRKFSAL